MILIVSKSTIFCPIHLACLYIPDFSDSLIRVIMTHKLHLLYKELSTVSLFLVSNTLYNRNLYVCRQILSQGPCSRYHYTNIQMYLEGLILFGFAQNESEVSINQTYLCRPGLKLTWYFLFWRKKWRPTVPTNSKAA